MFYYYTNREYFMAEDLVGKVINFFSGESNENLTDKEIVLKQRLKQLGDNKYSKFFKAKTEEGDPSLGQFFYSLYKLILPVRIFMKDITKTARLRQIVLEAFMDPVIIELVKQLNPAVIEQRSKNTPPEELTVQISKDIEELSAKFDANRIAGVNRCYNLLMTIFQLAHFDYPALLRKFDPNFTEGPFSVDPKFSPVKVSQIVKDISDFLAVSQAITPENDWKTLLKLLRICAGDEMISDTQFAQMLMGLRDVTNSKILELIVQYGIRNPVWACKPKIPDERIADSWLEVRIVKAQECIDRLSNAEKNKQISALLKDVFYGGDLTRLENYTPAKSDFFRTKDLSYYTYAEGLNYLAVFLSEYIEKDIRELFDILLIRGQWTNNTNSKELSEEFHQLLTMPEAITKLDMSLTDEGSNGSRLKASLMRVERDSGQARYIDSIIDSVNDDALEIINKATQHLSVMEKHLKNLTDDMQRKHPELIINWKELSNVSKNPLFQEMAENHQRINSFAQLMRLCASLIPV
jgi:hypothetical protein